MVWLWPYRLYQLLRACSNVCLKSINHCTHQNGQGDTSHQGKMSGGTFYTRVNVQWNKFRGDILNNNMIYDACPGILHQIIARKLK